MGIEIKLFDRSVVKRALPLNLAQEHVLNFEKDYERKIPKSSLWLIKKVLVTKEAVVFKYFRLDRRSLTSPRISIEFGPKYRLRNLFLSSKRLKKQKINFCFNSWYPGYFHWMTECLPRFYIAKNKSSYECFFIPEFLENYHRESLRALGLEENQMISLNKTYKINDLAIIERLAPSGNYNDAIMRELSGHIKSNAGLKQTQPFRKIYVSRSKAKIRKVLNEGDVIKEMHLLGFEVIYLEDFSFQEQVKLFSETEVFISIHGGGLTNMMFMQPKSKVLEIRKEGDKMNLCYYSLANTYSLDYYYLFGKPNDPNQSVQGADLHVSTSELVRIIKTYNL